METGTVERDILTSIPVANAPNPLDEMTADPTVATGIAHPAQNLTTETTATHPNPCLLHPANQNPKHTDPDAPPPIDKQKPNFKSTGLLAKETNTVQIGTAAIELKYNEPPDARKPPASQPWRLYIFKGADTLATIELFSRSAWLVGREAAVADLLVEHPSTSKQHAAIQFRHSTKVNEYGDRENKVKPYVVDLGSANGTMLNGEVIEKERYVELRDGDLMKFGLSEREYLVQLPPKGM
ncbi:SMAD/FHA domain-containing protein [Aulographum hederae CBS 113979]|uniref:SMAD/FHA domain-containing protein n=1 Tax=Aulographum hederae CBS 113979 TaxID=1176131 RepID=A0A6G1GTI5_9PEZI|nr:SMAD/FHA domain-containing protein [Aulographum hederae CBS 113979]